MQTLLFEERLNCFIGLNSSGKTAAMMALQKLFGNRSDRMLTREDFHIPSDESDDDEVEKSLSIEVIVKFAERDEAIPTYFEDMVVQAPGEEPYMRICLDATWSPSPNSLEGEIESEQYILTAVEGEEGDAESKKGFNKELFSLFQVIYVPAIRKTSDQLRYASGSILHRLLKTVNYSAKFKSDFKDATDVINGMFNGLPSLKSIQDALKNSWSAFQKDSRYKEAFLNFGTGELEEILKKLEVNFTPGHGEHRRFLVDDLGDGYRSLFYLTLVHTLLEVEEKLPLDTQIDGNFRPLLTILEVEEPENHIAPQLLGRVVKILQKLSLKSNTQVFITSHTPAIVKRLDPEVIHHFHLSDETTTEVNRIQLPEETDDAYKYVKEAVQNYPEVYFAKLVVIGEGDSEEVLFNHLMRVMDTDFDDNIITFAPLGHRFVNHIWSLLETIKIPFITLLDLDLGRTGGGWGRIKYALKELLNVGEEREEVLKIKGGGVLSEAVFEKMHERDPSKQALMQIWLRRLSEFDVYFCDPLDLDFVMLEAYEDYYTHESAYPDGDGPNIPDKEKKRDKYDTYIDGAIEATLKSEDADANLYSEEQQELMIWYRYLFLGRGKPVTHIQVLSQIPDDELKDNLPPVFNRIFKRIEEILS